MIHISSIIFLDHLVACKNMLPSCANIADRGREGEREKERKREREKERKREREDKREKREERGRIERVREYISIERIEEI